MKNPFSSTLYRCAHCTGQFPFGDIRYTNDGKRIVCLDCYARIMKSSEQLKKEKDYPKTEKAKIAPLTNMAPDDGIKLICVDCRYKYTLKNPSSHRAICPYCGKNNLIKDEITTDSLIEEASLDTEKMNLGKFSHKRYFALASNPSKNKSPSR